MCVCVCVCVNIKYEKNNIFRGCIFIYINVLMYFFLTKSSLGQILQMFHLFNYYFIVFYFVFVLICLKLQVVFWLFDIEKLVRTLFTDSLICFLLFDYADLPIDTVIECLPIVPGFNPWSNHTKDSDGTWCFHA